MICREQNHVEGFSAEVAWVTHGGKGKLEKRKNFNFLQKQLLNVVPAIAVRPTSETAMYKVCVLSRTDESTLTLLGLFLQDSKLS